jgi:ATP-dependent DNA helicase RecG
MLVFNAERFGLAQLHQLRGRIGRGAHKSYCILMHDATDAEGAAKLAILAETADGFRIAEEDLKLRGPGNVLGTAQSGLPGLRLGDLVGDTHLLVESRRIAEAILEEDPRLEAEQNLPLRDLLITTEGALSQVS